MSIAIHCTFLFALAALLQVNAHSQTAAAGPSGQHCSIEGAHGPSKNIRIDRYGDQNSAHVVMYLNGSGGPESHLDWIHDLANHGMLVLVPHYFDATNTRDATDRNYADWAQAVADAFSKENARLNSSAELGLMGYSLGASVALVMSTQCNIARHVVSWEGSLPDFYFMHLRTMPPLLILHGEDDSIIPFVNASQLDVLCKRLGKGCELKSFKGQGHIFSQAKAQEAVADAARFLQSR